MNITATTPPATLNFRVKLARDLPTWWNDEWGSRYHFPLGLFLDIYADSADFAVKARFPDFAPPDAFVWFAQDRQIDRGFIEPLVSYRARLKKWLDLWIHAGSAWAVTLALASYITPNVAIIRTVSNNSSWDTLPAGSQGPPEHQLGDSTGAANWDWDSNVWPNHEVFDPTDPEYAAKWWRVWVILYPAANLWAPAPKCGAATGGKCGGGLICGWTGTPDQARSLQAQVAKWKPAHVKVPFIIICFDPAAFAPNTVFSAPPPDGIIPDGRWGTWGHRDGRIYVPTRAQVDAAYCPGVN